MKSIKLNYDKLYKKLEEYDTLLIDTLLDLYTFPELKEDFKDLESEVLKLSDNLFYDMILEIAKTIIQKKPKDKEFINKIARKNNKYLENSKYLEMDNTTLKTEFQKDIPIGIMKMGISPNLLLFYYYTHNIFTGEKIEFLEKEYMDSVSRLNSIDFEKQDFKVIGLNDLKNALNLHNTQYEDILSHLQLYLENKYYIDNEIELLDKCKKILKIEEVDDPKKLIVPKGFLYFIYSYFSNLIDATQEVNKLEGYFLHNLRRMAVIYKELKNKSQIYQELVNSNNKLKNENKKLKTLLNILTNKVESYKKSDTERKLMSENQSLLKENYYLKTKIEELENYIKILEEQEKINEEITQDISITEIEKVKPQHSEIIYEKIPDFSNVVIVGGRYTSKEKDIISNIFAQKNIEITFIPAEKTLQKIDIISSADIVIFDTSYNAHSYYYKVKKVAKNLLHTNKLPTNYQLITN